MVDRFAGIKGFNWDEGNLDKNWHRHQVANWECEQVFFNEPLMLLADPVHSVVEQRWAAFGKSDGGRRLTVIFTIRGDRIRVISARDMSRKERAYYGEKG